MADHWNRYIRHIELATRTVTSPYGNWVGSGAGTPTDWAIVGYLGLVQIGLAYVLLVRGLRDLRAIEISLLLILEPVLATGWALLVHGEVPGAWSLAGCSLILAGILTQALRPAE